MTDSRVLIKYPLHVFGALAQLGERMAGSHEVRGSIPLGSTINFSHLRVAFFCYPNNPLLSGDRTPKIQQPSGLSKVEHAKGERRPAISQTRKRQDPPRLHHR